MPTEDLLDFDRLATPISDDEPGGEDLRHDPLRDELALARRPRVDALDPAADVEPDWETVRSLAETALYERSKDLEIVGWLAEALLHLHGAAGLRDGLRATHVLLEQFWDHLYPVVQDEDDLEVRAARIEFLSSPVGGPRVPQILRVCIPVAVVDDGGEAVTFDYADPPSMPPQRDAGASEAWERRRSEIESRTERARAAVESTDGDFYVLLHDDLRACLDWIARLDEITRERLGPHGRSWTALRESVEDVERFAARILRERGLDGSGDRDGEASDSADGRSDSRGAEGGGDGTIRSRAEAVRRLKECAAYLRRNEPHSLVASLVDRAVHWAELPLSQVLTDLIKDEAALEKIRETLGFGPGAASSDAGEE